jgi:hypothetical protein
MAIFVIKPMRRTFILGGEVPADATTRNARVA